MVVALFAVQTIHITVLMLAPFAFVVVGDGLVGWVYGLWLDNIRVIV
jgi:hypothetical protein